MLEETKKIEEHSKMQDQVIAELKNNQRHHETKNQQWYQCLFNLLLYIKMLLKLYPS